MRDALSRPISSSLALPTLEEQMQAIGADQALVEQLRRTAEFFMAAAEAGSAVPLHLTCKPLPVTGLP
jgi:hypothetical protein